ncbi:MAG: hypothetical protein ACI9RG_000663 [Sulfurimonas sp.]|jgi:hypothetical protein
MRLRLLISMLFIIATSIIAIHEIEHISGEHDSSTCQICMVDNHSLSFDVIDIFQKIDLIKYENISSIDSIYHLYKKDYAYQNRAPPIKS